VGEIFTRIENVRLMWFKSANPGTVAWRYLEDSVDSYHGM